MIIEVVARNHAGFNERIFTKMELTDRDSARRERRCSALWCSPLHVTAACKAINSNSRCDKDAAAATTVCEG